MDDQELRKKISRRGVIAATGVALVGAVFSAWPVGAEEKIGGGEMPGGTYIQLGPFYVLLFDPQTQTNKFLSVTVGLDTPDPVQTTQLNSGRSRIQAGLNRYFRRTSAADLRGSNGSVIVHDALVEVIKQEFPAVTLKEALVLQMLIS
ncbi:flagellar basal body-associated FliL family protein [Radicibacter daui]|uniref:flagellar basal body-associated FliL family protein n=1 Tax=Radicibacter daui TaxID=3064829 RepID=UPI0040468F82